MAPPRPTLITVARLAGVSVASVSRVLNGGSATPAMEQRVRTAAGQLGYVPDAGARSLRAGRTQQLALAVADVGNPTYVAMMRGIESKVRASGYRLLVHSTGSDSADEVSLVESLGHRYVNGLIICPSGSPMSFCEPSPALRPPWWWWATCPRAHWLTMSALTPLPASGSRLTTWLPQVAARWEW